MSGVDDDFGRRLRDQRLARGWRQRDLVEAWDGEVARSTLANVESGRERPTPRLWELIGRVSPEWVPVLEASYRLARREPAHHAGGGGTFRLERLHLSCLFRHGRALEEVISVWRVRALRHRADGYALERTELDRRGFRLDEEVLWGGHLDPDGDPDGDHRCRVVFDRELRRGQTHEFAVRSWVAHDPDPGTRVQLSFTVPVDRFTVSLGFLGAEQPERCFALAPHEGEPLALSPAGSLTHDFTDVRPGTAYGVGWRWSGP